MKFRIRFCLQTVVYFSAAPVHSVSHMWDLVSCTCKKKIIKVDFTSVSKRNPPKTHFFFLLILLNLCKNHFFLFQFCGWYSDGNKSLHLSVVFYLPIFISNYECVTNDNKNWPKINWLSLFFCFLFINLFYYWIDRCGGKRDLNQI